MEKYFLKFREGIIGDKEKISTPYHDSIKITYADWTASGRMFRPIEDRLKDKVYPFVANTHTDTNDTGLSMTYAYHKAQEIIKKHVGASSQDVLIATNSGMTGVVNKFQRILGLKIHEKFQSKVTISEADRPVVFVSHMEHHSNQTSWMETIAEVVIVSPCEKGLLSLDKFKQAIALYPNRKNKIAAITSCSNVTGIMTPYMDVAEFMHSIDGLCFVDFACSAPYIDINMHEEDSIGRYLDAIYFSPHKFLGGPGTSGVLLFNQKLYSNNIPDNPGGGTVDWTNPWGNHKYIDNIEAREDGGTPGFLQAIKTAMCMQLKDEMGTANIHKRESQIIDYIWSELADLENLHILAKDQKDRLGVVSFYIDDLHYNVGVKMLNDKFGIQTRGGCSCAGTYGHFLLAVSEDLSNSITSQISQGDCTLKPGWIRMSIHPTQSSEEIEFIVDGIKQLANNHSEWIEDYNIDLMKGSIKSKRKDQTESLENKIDLCFTESFV